MDIEHVKKACAKMQEAMDMLGCGPLDYYLRNLVAAHDILMKRYAPLKVGDRVELLRSPNYKTAPGWERCKHFLVPGAIGTVEAATCGERGFCFEVIFDEESWVDTVGHQLPKGTIVPIEAERRHRYSFGEGWLLPLHRVTVA